MRERKREIGRGPAEHALFVAALAVALLANVERDIPVLDHVADLSLHRDREQNAEVHQEDGPEHRDVK